MTEAWDTVIEPTTKKKSGFQPSEYQKAIFDAVPGSLGRGEHIVVQAVAGSGKTTTGVELFGLLPDGLDTAFVAFNSAIAKELGARLPRGANARTYHSLGLMTLKQTYNKVQVNADKVNDFLQNELRYSKWAIPASRKLVSLCKGQIKTEFDDEDLRGLAFMFDVELYNEDAEYKIFAAVRRALQDSLDNPQEVDFDDMIWLPNVLDHISFYEFDFLLIDEVQDTNAGQLHLAVNSIKDTGMILGIGDRNQSIYAFRGADSSAMDKLTKQLEAKQMPLSLSYRCPKSVAAYVNANFPDIDFKVPDTAIDGTVSSIMSSEKLLDSFKDGDMVLCRVNADLISTAFRLIRAGRKATIQGRDIGKGLVDLIKKSKEDDVTKMLQWVQNWKAKEIAKAYSLGFDGKATMIQDRADTVFAVADGAATTVEVIERCYSLFSDEQSGIKLSSVHRAKGLEADNVFILRPDLMPHPAAKKPEAQIQERNIKYVAVTRAKKSLTFVM